jgi:hypothetical protein
MNTNQAAYWIALGVLALGLNNEYQHGKFVTLHKVAERADSALCRISARAEQTLAVARILTSREGGLADTPLASSDDVEMARAQSEMLREQARDGAALLRDGVRDHVRDEIRAQTGVIRARTEVQRSLIEQIRWRARSQFRLANMGDRRVVVVCPKTGVKVAVSAGPEFAEGSPDIEMERTF